MHDNDYALREATICDAPTLCGLMAEFYAEDDQQFDPRKAEEAFRDLLSDNRFGRAWLIEIGGQTAGYIVLTFSITLEFYGRDAFIDDFFIRPDFRGRGIGRKVLADMEAFARRESIQVLFLEAHDTLKPHLLDFYAAAGFTKRPFRLMSKTLGSE